MFGRNEIVGRKFFNDKADSLLVTSIFETIQGEGPYQGRAAFFVRLSKCNLACSFCDTAFDTGDWIKIEDLCNDLAERMSGKMAGRRRRGLVITGGEPSLQSEMVFEFLHRVQPMFSFTQIESNGILPMQLPCRTVLVVSPKAAPNEGLRRYAKVHDDTLMRADCLKFVLSDEPDTVYNEVPKWAFEWMDEHGKPIYVSPMNMYRREPAKSGDTLAQRSGDEVVSFWEPGLLDMEANKRNHEYAARYALKHGLYLTLQQHLYASLA